MNTIRILSCLAIALLLTGCNKIFNKPESVTSLDVSNAIYLAIDESVDFDSDQGNNLIKITSEDQLSDPEIAHFIDEAGNFLKDPFVKAESWNIISASKDYSILDGEYIFKIKGEDMRSLNLLLNNKTGALYDLMGVYRPEHYNEYMGSDYYQTDKNGNIYYQTSGIHRINVGDPENITVESYVDYAAGLTEDPYFVSKDGDVFFAKGRRVKNHLGGILETNMDIVCFEGLDGKTYGFQNDIPDGLNVLSLKIEAGKLNSEVLRKSDFYFESGIERTILYNDTSNQRQLFMEPILFPEYAIDFENHHLIGFVFNQNSWSQSPILVDLYLLDECWGMEGAYIWFTTHTEKFLALNLESITINQANNVATVEEILEFEIPSNFQMGSMNYDIKEPGIHFSAYDLQTEKSYRCSFTVKNGFVYFEDLSPKIVSLTRIQ
ncbi:MAG: hypothetical protein PF450_06870 [Bacteroidales bacterium]|jgi:hypothetical protein|nr:hypothetical protein [Bacteroidales bacterium]